MQKKLACANLQASFFGQLRSTWRGLFEPRQVMSVAWPCAACDLAKLPRNEQNGTPPKNNQKQTNPGQWHEQSPTFLWNLMHTRFESHELTTDRNWFVQSTRKLKSNLFAAKYPNSGEHFMRSRNGYRGGESLKVHWRPPYIIPGLIKSFALFRLPPRPRWISQVSSSCDQKSAGFREILRNNFLAVVTKNCPSLPIQWGRGSAKNR